MVAAALTGSGSLRTFADVMSDKEGNERRLKQGFMSGAQGEEAGPRPLRSWPVTREETDDLLQSALESAARGERPVNFVDAEDDFLLSWSEVRTFVRSQKVKVWPSSLRGMLEATLADDATLFAVSTPDHTSRQLDEICSDKIDFLVAGHTHLQRALEREHARGTYYFNSGTWIRLARIPREALSTAENFEQVELRLTHGSMRQLDDEPFKLALDIRTVVKIAADPECGARGELFNVIPAATARGRGQWGLVPVPDSALPRRRVQS